MTYIMTHILTYHDTTDFDAYISLCDAHRLHWYACGSYCETLRSLCVAHVCLPVMLIYLIAMLADPIGTEMIHSTEVPQQSEIPKQSEVPKQSEAPQ